MDKIIFLDIDGVLNSEKFCTQDDYNGEGLDRKAVELLNQLYDNDVFIVISSTWGSDAYEMLSDADCKIPVHDCTERRYKNWICRGNEILKWLDDNNYHVNMFNGDSFRDDLKYVIIDDDCDMLLSQKDHFVHIDNLVGLTQEDIDKCKKILEI